MEPPLWSEGGASRYTWEREALEFLRAGLPNHEPFRAWPNVEFIGDDGTINEVDLLVVVPNGVFLIEIKSYPDGVLSGDTQQWRWRRPDGRVRSYDHPLIATDRKAKRLKSLLARQKALRSERRVPFIHAMVFLSGPDLSVQLEGPARAGVVGRGDSGHALPGVHATLKDPTLAGYRASPINRPLSKAFADAVLQAGIRPMTSHLTLGDWALGEVLDEGPGWQDFAATRSNPNAERRIRIFLAGRSTSEADEARLKASARQEFRLLERLRHPNISHALDLQQHEYGPALLLDRAAGEQRLDHWVPDHLSSLDLLDRYALVRQLGEALSYAHRRGVAHRMLTPRNVLVREPDAARRPTIPELVIGHWNLGTAEEATRLTMHSRHAASVLSPTSIGREMADQLAEQDLVFVAPEVFRAEHPNGIAADVFSLGAVAALVFSGKAPAADLAAREAAFATRNGFVLTDSLPVGIVEAIAFATDPNPVERFRSIDEFLRDLDRAFEEATSPTTEVDPLSAAPGDILEGGWKFLRRLGGGATAVAFLCQRGPVIEVLKVARTEEHAQRLRDEAEALERLWSLKPAPVGVVEYRGIDRVAGHTTLHLALAGDIDRVDDMTLGSRLRRRGRPGLDMLARWGDDLLETLSILERAGVAHRDIKPDNLGVTERGKNREPHLVLFDFSFAKTAATDLSAGTPGYLDPFLPDRPSRRWDSAADRYSAAVTLFEMATGARPLWGDGGADPRHTTDDLPNVESSLFDPSVADRLARFFERALRRDPARRFGTAEEMRTAWHHALSATSTPTEPPPSLTAAGWDPEQPIQQIGLSPAAVDLLEGIGVHSVGLLVDVSSPAVSRIRTVSNTIRQEILSAAAAQRRQRDADADADAESESTAHSIDAFVARLLPSETGPLKAQRVFVARLLGLEPPVSVTVPGSSSEPNAWLGTAEARRIGLATPDEVRSLLSDARKRWTRGLRMKELRDDLVSLLTRSEGIASGDELARALVARRGTTATKYERIQRGRAVVRAALETMSEPDGVRWQRLPNGGVVVSLAEVGHTNDDGYTQQLADYATELGRCADEISDADPLFSPQRALAMLRSVTRPPDMKSLSDARLLRLAADSSISAALSSRNELYTRAMPGERALTLARPALLVPGLLSAEQIRERVGARFPDAEPVPPLAELVPLLADAGLEWTDGPPGGFRVATATNLSQSTAFPAYSTRLRTVPATDEAAQLRDEIQTKLDRSVRDGGYLVCSVEPSRFLLAERALERLGAATVDVDTTLLDALHEIAEARNITWDAILAADAAGPGGPRWGNLERVAKLATARIEATALALGPVVVLTRCGLLERFDELGLLDRLRDATTRAPRPGQVLRTLWVLVPSTDLTAAPTISGGAVPTTPGSSERLALEAAWFEQGTNR